MFGSDFEKSKLNEIYLNLINFCLELPNIFLNYY